jgi:hypothetical protein
VTGKGWVGAHAEYVAVPVGRLARKPAGVTHEDAAGGLFGGAHDRDRESGWRLRSKKEVVP